MKKFKKKVFSKGDKLPLHEFKCDHCGCHWGTRQQRIYDEIEDRTCPECDCFSTRVIPVEERLEELEMRMASQKKKIYNLESDLSRLDHDVRINLVTDVSRLQNRQDILYSFQDKIPLFLWGASITLLVLVFIYSLVLNAQ